MPLARLRRIGATLCLTAPLIAALTGAPAAAEPLPAFGERVTLGHGRLFTNDLIGDGRDRWRSGAYVFSRVRGRDWTGTLPDRPGEILEWRLRSEIIQPASLTAPRRNDRRYAGVLAVGVHSHFALGRAEASLGAELVATGPMTLVGDFQRAVHGVFGMPSPDAALARQIGNAIHPTVLGEVGLPLRLGETAVLRPFVEAQAGVETFARVGADLVVGAFGQSDLMLRDVPTGQRYRGVQGGPPSGFSLILGGDVAHVASSAYLPAGGVARLSPTRLRLRAGVHWQGDRSEVFYGITRLGAEFDQQPVGQTVGSLRLSFRF
jgi:hypothetical protein